MAQNSPAKSRNDIPLIIFGVLVGLILKGSLDATFAKSFAESGPEIELVHLLWALPTLQLVIFLVTFLRFVYGAYRVIEVIRGLEQRLEGWVPAWTVLELFALFTLFYLAGLSVANVARFYWCLVIVHAWDLLGFIIPALFSDRLEAVLKTVIRRFLVIDVGTIFCLFTALRLASLDMLPAIGAAVMLLAGFLDILWNWSFLFRDGNKRDDQPLIQAESQISTTMTSRVYLAAPLFTQAEWQWNAALAAECRKLNLESLKIRI